MYTGTLYKLADERARELRREAAAIAVADAVRAERKRELREAALARLKAADADREDRAVFSWQSQRTGLRTRRLRGTP